MDLPVAPAKYCSVDGCDRELYARSFCQGHYRRYVQGGDTTTPLRVGRASSIPAGDGYRMVYMPEHTNANSSGYIMVHRLRMTEYLGRPLLPDENVHHMNGDRSDNRIENLELWSTSQPSGQRVRDKVVWAQEILSLYAPHTLRTEQPDTTSEMETHK